MTTSMVFFTALPSQRIALRIYGEIANVEALSYQREAVTYLIANSSNTLSIIYKTSNMRKAISSR